MAEKTPIAAGPEPTTPPPLTSADVTATMVLSPAVAQPFVSAAGTAAAPATVNDILPSPGGAAAPAGAAAGGGQTPADAVDETDLWVGRYSLRNFLGRFVLRGAATAAWLALAYYTWIHLEASNAMFQMWAILGGLVVLFLWLHLGLVILRTRLGHHYRLTNRRLFVSTGIFRHRRDQVELIKVKDVYVRQASLFQRWADVGTVVIESSEDRYPTTYLLGVNEPKRVMDLLWRSTRREREGTSVQVENI
jgi:membrane protein YdbS with pleckstrin-like domain